MPRIKMASEHDYFVGFVTAGNFRNRVVGSCAFGIDMVNDIELQCDISSIRQNSRDASKIFIAHDNGRHGFVDIKRAVIKGTYLAKLTAGIVHPNNSAVVAQEQIELLEVDRSGIHVAEYLTVLPSREALKAKLHQSIASARMRLAKKRDEADGGESS